MLAILLALPSLAEAQAEPCVIDEAVANQLNASVCPPLANPATTCTRPHKMLDYAGNRRAALAALTTFSPTGLHGELDDGTELCALWDAGARVLDKHQLITELRAAADDGCFQGTMGQSWHPDGALMLDGLIRWRAVAHFFGAWAADHELSVRGGLDWLLQTAYEYGPAIFAMRAPPMKYNSVMHYVVLQTMATWAVAVAPDVSPDLAPGPTRTTWLIRNVSAHLLARCYSSPNPTGILGTVACVHGIGHGVFQIVVNSHLPYSVSACTPLRFKPQRSAIVPAQQQTIFEEAALGLYRLILQGGVRLSASEAVNVYGGLTEAYFATISVATPDEFVQNNSCAQLWERAGELLKASEQTGLIDPQNIRQTMSSACLDQANQWVHGFNMRKVFVREWQDRFRTLTSAQCHVHDGEPWGGVNACRMSSLRTVANLQDEPSVAFWCDLIHAESPREKATFFDDWWLAQCVPWVCGTTDVGTDVRATAVHSLNVADASVWLRNASHREAAMAACRNAIPIAIVSAIAQDVQRVHVAISERRTGAAYDRWERRRRDAHVRTVWGQRAAALVLGPSLSATVI